MPALYPEAYAEFARMLEELGPEITNMKDTPRNFMSDMVEKNKLYGERVFVSPKQLAWVKQLHEEYVGNTDHDLSARSERGKDMDDDIPF